MDGDRGEKEVLGNFKPITLLNMVYKIVAKVLANRMKKVLPKVISEDAVEAVADVIDAATVGKEDWYLLLVDFQKAYDSGPVQVAKAEEMLSDFRKVSGLHINKEKQC
ncbi:unnamed protein product [Closterium sp. NIES-54]